MEVNRLRPGCPDGKVCYLGNISVYRSRAPREYGMGGAACTYWNIDRQDGTSTVWFTQHMDMPDYADIEGVNAKHCDLWALLHKAIKKGSARRGKTASASSARKRVTSKLTSSGRALA